MPRSATPRVGGEWFGMGVWVVKLDVVEAVLFGAEECLAALTIRSGIFGRGLRIVDIDEVEAVDEQGRLVRVRSEGTEVFL
jgi:hypothetical protein